MDCATEHKQIQNVILSTNGATASARGANQNRSNTLHVYVWGMEANGKCTMRTCNTFLRRTVGPSCQVTSALVFSTHST